MPHKVLLFQCLLGGWLVVRFVQSLRASQAPPITRDEWELVGAVVGLTVLGVVALLWV